MSVVFKSKEGVVLRTCNTGKVIVFILFISFLCYGRSDIASLKFTSQERAFLNRNKKIVLSIDNTYPPRNFKNARGNLVGISVDYMKLLGKKLGVKIVFQGSTWDQALKKAMEHKVDGVVNASKLPERVTRLNFTKSYANFPQAVLSRKGSIKVVRLEDLAGKKIAVKRKSAQYALLKKTHSDIRLIEVSTVMEGVNLVNTGKVDGVFDDIAVIYHHITEHSLSHLEVCFVYYDDLLGKSRIGLRNNSPMLLKVLNKAIMSITHAEHQQIQKKWLATPSKSSMLIKLTKKEKDWLNRHQNIRVAVDADFAPIEFMGKEKIYKGMAIDYMRLIEKGLGVKFNIIRGFSWAVLLTRAKSKQVDMFTAIASTEKRKPFLNFTKPFLKVPIVIFSHQRISYIRNLSELEGKTVAVVEGFSVQEWLKKAYPKLKLLGAVNKVNALEMVKEGKAFALVGDLLSTSHYIALHGFSQIKVVGDTPFKLELSIGVRKDWPIFIRILDKTLRSLNEETRLAISRRWLSMKMERSIDSSILVRILLGVVVIILGFLIWNWSLHYKVTNRTLRLQEELAERERTESRLTASLKEKELLLKEVHHRVKNNLQVISSLLSLQSDQVESEEAKQLFLESQGRVKSMSLVYERIYKAKDFAEIDFEEYIHDTASQIISSFGLSMAISFNITVENVVLNLDKAMPCALLINELVTNAVKHAFHDQKKGVIAISMKQENKLILLEIRDNGKGLPEGYNVNDHETLGMVLVQQLTTQMKGKLSVYNENGAIFQIRFVND